MVSEGLGWLNKKYEKYRHNKCLRKGESKHDSDILIIYITLLDIIAELNICTSRRPGKYALTGTIFIALLTGTSILKRSEQ